MDQRPGNQGKAPPRGGPVWLLLLSALIAAAAGGAYLWQWQHGLRGPDLLGFTSLWVALPLALALILMFSYFNKQRKH